MKIPLLAKIRTRKVSVPSSIPADEVAQLCLEIKRLILARQAALRKTA
jgi:hypothetical protein